MVPTIDEVLAHAETIVIGNGAPEFAEVPQAHRRGPDDHRLRARLRLAHHRRRLRGHMLVSSSPAALRFSADARCSSKVGAERLRRSSRARARGYVERVYVRRRVRRHHGPPGGPPNLVRVVHDGVRIPLPEGMVDVAFSRSSSSRSCRHLPRAEGRRRARHSQGRAELRALPRRRLLGAALLRDGCACRTARALLDDLPLGDQVMRTFYVRPDATRATARRRHELRQRLERLQIGELEALAGEPARCGCAATRGPAASSPCMSSGAT